LRNGSLRTRLVAIHGTGRSDAGPARSDAFALAREVLARLDENDAALAIYLYCDELTHEEIAELLGCSRRHVGDLAQRLHRRIEERVA